MPEQPNQPTSPPFNPAAGDRRAPRGPMLNPTGASGFGDKDDHVVERRSLRDYYIILRERLWIALPAAIIVAVAVGYVQARKTPMYSAQATMLFEKPERTLLTTGVSDNSVTSDADLKTQVQLLNSGILRNLVFESFLPEEIKILQRPFLKNLQPGMAPPNDQRLLGNPSAAALPQVYIVRVSVTHQDPVAAALVANRFIAQYIRYKSGILGEKNTTADTDLKSSRVARERELAEARDKATKFLNDNKLTGADGSSNVYDTQLKAVQDAITSSNLIIDRLDGQLQQIDDYQKQKKDLLELSQILNGPNVLSYKQKLDLDNAQYSVVSEIYGRNADRFKAIVGVLDTDEANLKQAENITIQGLQNNLAQEKQKRDNLVAQTTSLTTQSLALREKFGIYNSLKAAETQAQSNLKAVEERLGQTTVQKEIEKIPLSPLDAATAPGAPYEPNLQNITKTCIGIGLLVFVGVAVGLSFIDDRIKSAWDVEHFVGVNLLGIIPDLSALKDEDKYTLVLNNRQVPGMESFLSVYSSVKIHSKLDFPKSILVTSTIPGEGKTLISSNLAGSFARHGKKTLLIDCDLRRPMIHRNFKQPNTAGIIPWFENGASVEGDLTVDPHLGIIKISEDFSLLTSGGRSKSPTEIFESASFGQLVDKLKKHYDLVVIDSPPLGAVADSLLIAECTDEVIYVCRFNRAYRKHIRLYIKALRSGKNEILGVVLNGLSPRRIEYYSNYRYYRSYKKYYGAQT